MTVEIRDADGNLECWLVPATAAQMALVLDFWDNDEGTEVEHRLAPSPIVAWRVWPEQGYGAEPVTVAETDGSTVAVIVDADHVIDTYGSFWRRSAWVEHNLCCATEALKRRRATEAAKQAATASQ